MDTMERLFEVVDDLEISREAIQVPLLPAGEGSVRALPNGHIEIVVPEGDLEVWLPELRRLLRPLAPEIAE